MESSEYNCVVHAETLFLMADGVTFKSIQDISASEEVMTVDLDTTGTLDYTPTKIYDKYTKMSKKLYQVESDGNKIKLTDEQLILAEFTFDVPFTHSPDKIHNGEIVYAFCENRKVICLSVIKNVYQVENEMVYYFKCNKNIFVTSSFIISNGEPKTFDPI
jgi:hypothetical protein